jgi:hypothetical protein
MKTNDVTRYSSNATLSGSDVKELDTFNRRRAARGLLPVTQEEFNELLVKITGFVSFAMPTPTFH